MERSSPMDNPSTVHNRKKPAAGDAAEVRAPKADPASAPTAIKRQLAAQAMREQQVRKSRTTEDQHRRQKSRHGRVIFAFLTMALTIGIGSLLLLNDPRSLQQNISAVVSPLSDNLAWNNLSWDKLRQRLPSVDTMRDALEKTMANAIQQLGLDSAAQERVAVTPREENQVPADERPLVEHPGRTSAEPSPASDREAGLPERDTAIVAAKYRHAARLLGLAAQTVPALETDPRLRSLIEETQRAAIEAEEQLAVQSATSIER